tara:strand:- start:67 stop:1314 length:1248 start_codon:yes stop_codon:yes gene_type:complete
MTTTTYTAFSQDWSLSGNSLSGSEFLGSTNAQPVKFRTDNTERMSIYSDGSVGIGTPSSLTSAHRLLDLRFNDSTAYDSSTYGNGLFITNRAHLQGSCSSVTLAAIATNNQGNITLNCIAVDDHKSDFALQVENGTSGAEMLEVIRAKYNGNVGIGTSTPGSYRLGVNGAIICASVVQTSDKRFKKDIHSIDNGLDIISKLNPTSYYFRNEEFTDRTFSKELSYGFIAQELEEVLPELVKEDAQGYKAVNYTGIIPILTSAIQEQNALLEEKEVELATMQSEIEALKAQFETLQQQFSYYETECCANSGTNENNGVAAEEEKALTAVSYGVLMGNSPNPFTETTKISYEIKTEVEAAQIMIMNLNGELIESFKLAPQVGNGQVMVSGNTLNAGMYLYTLVLDGKEIATQKMILSK